MTLYLRKKEQKKKGFNKMKKIIHTKMSIRKKTSGYLIPPTKTTKGFVKPFFVCLVWFFEHNVCAEQRQHSEMI